MHTTASVFDRNISNYKTQLSQKKLSFFKNNLSLEYRENKLILPFLGKEYLVSGDNITAPGGKNPPYEISIVLFKYLLLCPESFKEDPTWIAYKDLSDFSGVVNFNYFETDAEKPIADHFKGNIPLLESACMAMNGFKPDQSYSYDLIMQVELLPRISILLLFNDEDEEFPAQCRILFQKQVEKVLDPESLAVLGAVFAQTLKKLSKDLIQRG